MTAPAAPLTAPMGLQSLLVDESRPNVLLPQRLVLNSSPVSDAPLEAALLVSDSDSDSGPPFLQVSLHHHMIGRSDAFAAIGHQAEDARST